MSQDFEPSGQNEDDSDLMIRLLADYDTDSPESYVSSMSGQTESVQRTESKQTESGHIDTRQKLIQFQVVFHSECILRSGIIYSKFAFIHYL